MTNQFVRARASSGAKKELINAGRRKNASSKRTRWTSRSKFTSTRAIVTRRVWPKRRSINARRPVKRHAKTIIKKTVASLWVVFAVWIGAPALAGLASKPTANMPVVDGWVQAIAERDGTVYIGGKFARIGPWSGGGALVNANTGDIIEDFPKFNGVVWAAVTDGAGGYFIAGDFTEVGAVARSGFVHVTSQRKV